MFNVLIDTHSSMLAHYISDLVRPSSSTSHEEEKEEQEEEEEEEG